MKFEQKHYDYNEFTGEKLGVIETVVVETEEIELSAIIETFERFLKACGYHFDGKLDVLPLDIIYGVSNNE